MKSSINVKIDNKIVEMASRDNFDYDIYILQRNIKENIATILFKHEYSNYQLYKFDRETLVIKELYTFENEEEAQKKYLEII